MRAGELRHRVTLQRAVEAKDGIGSVDATWSDVATVWAAVWPLSSGEQVNNQQVEGRISHRVRIRYRSGVTGAMRVLFGTRVLDIIGPPINRDERNIYLELLCREVVA